VVFLQHDAAPGTPLVLGIAERGTQDAIDSARQILDTVAGAETYLLVQVPRCRLPCCPSCGSTSPTLSSRHLPAAITKENGRLPA
jgi:hypothetical protein